MSPGNANATAQQPRKPTGIAAVVVVGVLLGLLVWFALQRTQTHAIDHRLQSGYLINLNTADADELSLLPGVGPTAAQRIVTYREEHGPFAEVEQLVAVYRVGQGSVEKLRPYVRRGP